MAFVSPLRPSSPQGPSSPACPACGKAITPLSLVLSQDGDLLHARCALQVLTRRTRGARARSRAARAKAAHTVERTARLIEATRRLGRPRRAPQDRA
jgi:hypothetical protein